MEHNSAINIRYRNYSAASFKASSTLTYTIDNLIGEILSGKINRVVIMTGAGVSTNSGIPDFRSPGTGLYYNLSKFNIPYPEAIFEKEYFRRNPRPFFVLAKDLLPDIEKYKPNKVHYFLRLLQQKNILHRVYTQNIDGLECLSGIDSSKLVEAHGSFRSAKCIDCNHSYSGIYIKDEILKGKIPICRYGKCAGLIKPDIVFFGEELPNEFYKMYEHDFSVADCVIVMGTSLKVEPFSNLILETKENVPRLLLNKESVGPFKQAKLNSKKKDLQILGDLMNGIESLVEKLGWKSDLDELVALESKNIECLKNSILEEVYYKFKPNFIKDRKIISNQLVKPITKARELDVGRQGIHFNVAVRKVNSFDEILNRKTHNNNPSLTPTKKPLVKKKKNKTSKKSTKAKKKDFGKEVNENINPSRTSKDEKEASEDSQVEDDSCDDDEENKEDDDEENLEENVLKTIQEIKLDKPEKNSLEKNQQNQKFLITESNGQLIRKEDSNNQSERQLSIYNKFNKDYMSNFILNKYSIHLKLVNNLNKYNQFFALKEKNSSYQSKETLFQKKIINSMLDTDKTIRQASNKFLDKDYSCEENYGNVDTGEEVQKVIYKTTLFTANSKPALLTKRIQSASNKISFL